MLTDKKIRNAKPGLKVAKLYDGNGLVLRIKPNGTKVWEFKYRVPGPAGLKEKALPLGLYGEVSLKEAREKCHAARKLRSEGKDPCDDRKTQKQLARFTAASTFQAIAEEWREKNEDRWSENHAARLWARLEKHVLPSLGRRPISEITALDLLDVLQKLEDEKKTETAHRLLQVCRAIFQFAILTQRCTYNPAFDLKGALKAHRTTNYPSIGHNRLPTFLAKLEDAKTSEMTRLAIKLLMLTFVRQGELRQAQWRDIDEKSAVWRIRPETTKMRQEHIVPLAPQVMEVLGQLRLISGESIYLLPSQAKCKHPIMSENTINKVIHDMGYKGELVGHGFRSMASTILNESGFKADVIERQLAHMPRDKVRAAYNRAQYLPERKAMMESWADYLQSNGMVLDEVCPRGKRNTHLAK